MRLLPVLIMVVAGFFISIQGPINARLRLAVDSPVLSAAISFLSGGLVLLCIMGTGAFGGTGTGLRGMQSARFGPTLAACSESVLSSAQSSLSPESVSSLSSALRFWVKWSALILQTRWAGLESTRCRSTRFAWLGLGLWCLESCWCKGNILNFIKVRTCALTPTVRHCYVLFSGAVNRPSG